METIPLFLSRGLYHGLWLNHMDQYLALTDFMRCQLQAAGVPPDRISVVGNFVTDPGPPAPLGKDVLFLGRVDELKGIRQLVAAWHSGIANAPQLRVVGDGPLLDCLARETADKRANVLFRGRRSGSNLEYEWEQSAALVIPSRSFEGQPLTMLEGMARGRPVIATGFGAMSDVEALGVGWILPASEAHYQSAIKGYMDDRQQLESRGASGRQRYLQLHTPGSVIAEVLGVYETLMRGSAQFDCTD